MKGHMTLRAPSGYALFALAGLLAFGLTIAWPHAVNAQTGDCWDTLDCPNGILNVQSNQCLQSSCWYYYPCDYYCCYWEYGTCETGGAAEWWKKCSPGACGYTP